MHWVKEQAKREPSTNYDQSATLILDSARFPTSFTIVSPSPGLGQKARWRKLT